MCVVYPLANDRTAVDPWLTREKYPRGTEETVQLAIHC